LLLQSYPDHESLWMYLRSSVTPKGEIESSTPMRAVPSIRQFMLRHAIWWKISQGQEISIELLREALISIEDSSEENLSNQRVNGISGKDEHGTVNRKSGGSED